MTQREFMAGCRALFDAFVEQKKAELVRIAAQLVNEPPDGVSATSSARSACSAAAPRTSKRRRAAARPASSSPTTHGPREAVAANSAHAIGAVDAAPVTPPTEHDVAAPIASLSPDGGAPMSRGPSKAPRTERARQIVAMLLAGRRPRDIAAELGVTPENVYIARRRWAPQVVVPRLPRGGSDPVAVPDGETERRAAGASRAEPRTELARRIVELLRAGSTPATIAAEVGCSAVHVYAVRKEWCPEMVLPSKQRTAEARAARIARGAGKRTPNHGRAHGRAHGLPATIGRGRDGGITTPRNDAVLHDALAKLDDVPPDPVGTFGFEPCRRDDCSNDSLHEVGGPDCGRRRGGGGSGAAGPARSDRSSSCAAEPGGDDVLKGKYCRWCGSDAERWDEVDGGPACDACLSPATYHAPLERTDRVVRAIARNPGITTDELATYVFEVGPRSDRGAELERDAITTAVYRAKQQGRIRAVRAPATRGRYDLGHQMLYPAEARRG